MFTEGALLLERVRPGPRVGAGCTKVAARCDRRRRATPTGRWRPGWPRCSPASVSEILLAAPAARAGDRRGPAIRRTPTARARSTAAGTSSSPAPRARPATRSPARSPAAPSGPRRSGWRRVAAMGFDVIYLPPIHPIGEVNRKGPNNTLTPGPDDPGSPWAIGCRRGRARRDPPRPRHVRGLRRLRRPRRPSSGWRSPSTSPCSAPPTTRG